MGLKQVLQVRVDLGLMAMKRCSRSPEVESYQQIQLSVISRNPVFCLFGLGFFFGGVKEGGGLSPFITHTHMCILVNSALLL